MAAGEIWINSSDNKLYIRSQTNYVRWVSGSYVGNLTLADGEIVVRGYYLIWKSPGISYPLQALGDSNGSMTPGKIGINGGDIVYGSSNGYRMELGTAT